MTASQQTAQSIPQEAAETLLEALVAIPSPSGEEAAASRHLVQWMRDHDYDEAFVDDAGNAVGVRGSGSQTLVLLGHIDTFGGQPPVRRDGRLLYGRGSVDAKGSLCTFAVAAAQASLPDDWRVMVIGAVEEEAASSAGARHAMRQVQPQACIIGEPSQWDRITLGYKGRLLIEWEWRGALAHSAGQAASPPERAIAYWDQVREYVAAYNAGEERIFGQVDATLQDINSGQDGAYGWSRMTIGFRVPPTTTPNDIAHALPSPDDISVTIRVYGHEQAHVCERDSLLSRVMRGAIRAEGGTPRFVYKTGTADMNVVGTVWDCPMLAYGPGDSALDHTPDEHLDLDEYAQAIRVLTAALTRL